MWAAAQRLIGYTLNDQRAVILHLGDHDPSGIDMSRDIEDRLRLFMDHEGAGESFEFKRIALTMAQVREVHAPPNPAKITDCRYAAYCREYGENSWELDALEPQYIERLVRRHIERYIDGPRKARVERQEAAYRTGLDWAARNWDVIDMARKEHRRKKK